MKPSTEEQINAQFEPINEEYNARFVELTIQKMKAMKNTRARLIHLYRMTSAGYIDRRGFLEIMAEALEVY